MLSKKSSIVYGLPMSGRTRQILSSISRFESADSSILLSHPDVLFLDMSKSIEQISYSIDFFSYEPPIDLSSKYCIIRNIDFFSSEKQEIFLKSVEDSKTFFYFTAYSFHQIKTKALTSRLSSFTLNYDNFQEGLSKIQKQMISSSKTKYPFKSLSQVNLWNYLTSSIDPLLTFDQSFLESKKKFLEAVESIKDYPQWFTIDQTFLILSFSLRQRYLQNPHLSNLINKLIQNFSLADLSRIEALSLFLDACFLVKRSFKNHTKPA